MEEVIPGMGERGYWQRVKNARIIGQCALCGGQVKAIIGGRVRKDVRETLCTGCGMINPPVKRDEMKDEEVVEVMKRVYEMLTVKLRTEELEPTAFANVVEYVLGKSLGKRWKRDGLKWLEKAGLELTPWGMVRKRR